MHLRLAVGHSGLVLGGHLGGEMAGHPVAPLDEAEADQEGAQTGVGRYPHGGARTYPRPIPVLLGGGGGGGEVLLPPPPPLQPPLASAAGPSRVVVARKRV